MTKKEGGKPLGRRPAKRTTPALKGYGPFLAELKERIRNARLRAAIAVNHELVHLYWQIGRGILIRQGEHGWGANRDGWVMKAIIGVPIGG